MNKEMSKYIFFREFVVCLRSSLTQDIVVAKILRDGKYSGAQRATCFENQHTQSSQL